MTNNKLPNNMDVVVVIDTQKLPKDVQEVLKQLSQGKLPEGGPEKLKDILQNTGPPNIDNNIDSDDIKPSYQTKDKMFAIQTGTVIGNIYDKDFDTEKIINKK